MNWKTDVRNPEYGSERQSEGKHEIRLRLGGWPKDAVNTSTKGNTTENGKEKPSSNPEMLNGIKPKMQKAQQISSRRNKEKILSRYFIMKPKNWKNRLKAVRKKDEIDT